MLTTTLALHPSLPKERIYVAPPEGLSLLLIHPQAPHREALAKAKNPFSVSVSGASPPEQLDGCRGLRASEGDKSMNAGVVIGRD
jgi:hypothetical protein